MQIILTEKIRKLGALGETVNVKPGFARNYLIPQNKALMATKANLAKFEAERARLESLAQAQLDAAKARAEKLKDIVLTISASAGEGGKLFGSIGTRDIATAAKAAGIELNKHEIHLPHGVIRQIGEYEVALNLHIDVDLSIKVLVAAG